jgi:hypothetical protein
VNKKTVEHEQTVKLWIEIDTDGSAYVQSELPNGKRQIEVWFNPDETIEIMVPTGEERTQKLIASNFKELRLT